MTYEFDAVVIGAGMAGLTAARKIAEEGFETAVITRGLGATNMSSGAIDILGYTGEAKLVSNPEEGLKNLVKTQPMHPYSIIGKDANRTQELVTEAVDDFMKATGDAGLEYSGRLTNNLLLPTCLGTFKPTCLCQKSMANGDLFAMENSDILFVGIDSYPDFNAKYIASSLTMFSKRVLERDVIRSTKFSRLPLDFFRGKHKVSAIDIARALEEEANFNVFADKLASILKDEDLLALPAILGYMNVGQIHERLEEQLGCKIFEVLSIPPSVPGQRLQIALMEAALKNGVKFFNGFEASKASIKALSCKGIEATSIAGKKFDFRADVFILATGRFISGGIVSEKGKVFEPVFNLPVHIDGGELVDTEMFPVESHSMSNAGILVNSRLKPIDEKGRTIAENIYVVGSILSGYNYDSEKSGLGVALATGYKAGLEVTGSL